MEVVRKPMIITEWSFPALDSGLPCKHGAGMRVDTQDQKAACYRIFANAMADLPFLVGYHWFMWADEPRWASLPRSRKIAITAWSMRRMSRMKCS